MLLGSGGWIPTSRRETCSAYLRLGNRLVLIDAGTAIRHLVERPELLADVETVDIVLTHFHLDHVIGLTYLPALSLSHPPTIWGPGRLHGGSPTAEILERLLAPPFFGVGVRDLASSIREVPGGEFDVGPFTLGVRIQPRHSEPTLALRLGDYLTYCTDTAPDPENAAFAAGCQALLHEAWYAEPSSDDHNHSAAGDAGRLAREADAQRLILIHVNPLLRSDDMLVACAAAEFPATVVGRDLAPVPID